MSEQMKTEEKNQVKKLSDKEAKSQKGGSVCLTPTCVRKDSDPSTAEALYKWVKSWF
jgi:hypothetical protein